MWRVSTGVTTLSDRAQVLLNVSTIYNPLPHIQGQFSMSYAVRGSPLLSSLLPGYGAVIASVMQLVLI
jgi:hypothetical protein